MGLNLGPSPGGCWSCPPRLSRISFRTHRSMSAAISSRFSPGRRVNDAGKGAEGGAPSTRPADFLRVPGRFNCLSASTRTGAWALLGVSAPGGGERSPSGGLLCDFASLCLRARSTKRAGPYLSRLEMPAPETSLLAGGRVTKAMRNWRGSG